jgi:exonuclease SbcC
MERSAWSEFEERRDALAGLQPPPVDRSSLRAAWRGLSTWVADQAKEVEAKAGEARSIATRSVEQRDTRLAALRSACRDVGVEVGPGSVRDVVVEALAEVRLTLARVEEHRAEVARRLDARDEVIRSQRVADALGGHLRSGGFVSWLLAETLEGLLVGASARLQGLSQERYSLALDDKGGFAVVDHANADERRMVRTLSGGETFLASLALALALADEVASLAAVATPRLESIFLDEGFGTLDPESLDVVVSAIEDLHATGRAVGLVSHVPEVAERVPVRFEVTKAAATSTVERVVA